MKIIIKRNKKYIILLLCAWEEKQTDARGFKTDRLLVWRLLMLEQSRLARSSKGAQTKQVMFNTACTY